MFNWFITPKIKENNYSLDDMSVSVAESVTAGALSCSITAEPGSSKFFRGGVVAYSPTSKKEILNIDIEYAELNNHANDFTTTEMAKAASKMFKSRFGIATTGYSLPYTREANADKCECALNIEHPYAIICIYDALYDKTIISRETFTYDTTQPANIQRATVQARVAIKATKMYQQIVEEYKEKNAQLISLVSVN